MVHLRGVQFLLRCHVLELAQVHADGGQVLELVVQLGQAEIKQAHRPVRQHHDVLGREVAVGGDPVGVVQRAGNKAEHPNRRAEIKALPLLQPAPQALSLQVLHRVEESVLPFLRVVNLHNARMVELAGEFHLAHEAGNRMPARAVLAVKRLERDVPVGLTVVDQVHLAHPPPADDAADLIPVRHQRSRLKARYGRRPFQGLIHPARRLPCSTALYTALHRGFKNRTGRFVREQTAGPPILPARIGPARGRARRRGPRTRRAGHGSWAAPAGCAGCARRRRPA